ncbi:hypothetical protein, partial [Klebsiella pneumoniae]
DRDLLFADRRERELCIRDSGLRFAIREGGRTVGAGVVAKVLG